MSLPYVALFEDWFSGCLQLLGCVQAIFFFSDLAKELAIELFLLLLMRFKLLLNHRKLFFDFWQFLQAKCLLIVQVK